MKILLYADLEGKIPDFSVVSDPNSFDLILLAGDLTIGAKSEAKIYSFFEKFSQAITQTNFPENIPIFFIPGNHDQPILSKVIPSIPNNFIQMHNQISLFSSNDGLSVSILGFGGSTPIPFFPMNKGPNIFTYSENEIETALELLFEENEQEKQQISILLVHSPPYRTKLDMAFDGSATKRKAVGSNAIKKLIETYHPELVVCGHIHESSGIDQLGLSIMVNPGAYKVYQQYAIININPETCQILAKIEKERKK